jgi:hypothetical protein
MRWPSVTWAATRSFEKLLIMERFCMAEAWSAVPEWIRKAEADWIGEDERMRAALLPLVLSLMRWPSTCSAKSQLPVQRLRVGHYRVRPSSLGL